MTKLCEACGQEIKQKLSDIQEVIADEFRRAFLKGPQRGDFEGCRYTIEDVLKILSWPDYTLLDKRLVGDVIRRKWDITTRKSGGNRYYFLPAVNPNYLRKPIKMRNLKNRFFSGNKF
jgi:hypothetical protein